MKALIKLKNLLIYLHQKRDPLRKYFAKYNFEYKKIRGYSIQADGSQKLNNE